MSDGLYAERPMCRDNPEAYSLLDLERDPEDVIIDPATGKKSPLWREDDPRDHCDCQDARTCTCIKEWALLLLAFDRKGYSDPRPVRQPMSAVDQSARVAIMGERTRKGKAARHPKDVQHANKQQNWLRLARRMTASGLKVHGADGRPVAVQAPAFGESQSEKLLDELRMVVEDAVTDAVKRLRAKEAAVTREAAGESLRPAA